MLTYPFHNKLFRDQMMRKVSSEYTQRLAPQNIDVINNLPIVVVKLNELIIGCAHS